MCDCVGIVYRHCVDTVCVCVCVYRLCDGNETARRIEVLVMWGVCVVVEVMGDGFCLVIWRLG